MSEMSKFQDQKKKLQGLCDEHNLVFRFRNDSYPISLTIMPTGGVGAQMSLLENVEERGYTSPDAKIIIAYIDGEIDKQYFGTFTIGKALSDKIERIYEKMHFYWLQFFNREIIEKGVLKELPRIEQEEINDDEDAEDEAVPTVTTTIDSSGLVTHVQFSGEGSEDDDDSPPEDEQPEDEMPEDEDDDPENNEGAYDYDDPE